MYVAYPVLDYISNFCMRVAFWVVIYVCMYICTCTSERKYSSIIEDQDNNEIFFC